MKTEFSTKTLIYLRASELVGQGHCKNILWKHNEAGKVIAYCYRGALLEAESEITGVHRELAVVGWRPETNKFINWNNAPDTTAAMVAQKLREQAFT